MFEKRPNKKFQERKRATIYTKINCDKKKSQENNPSFGFREIKSESDLHNTGVKAKNKKHWKVVVKEVVQAAYSNTSIHQQQLKTVDNVHRLGGQQAEIVMVVVLLLIIDT